LVAGYLDAHEEAAFFRQGPLCLCFAPAMPSPLRDFEILPQMRQMHSLKVRFNEQTLLREEECGALEKESRRTQSRKSKVEEKASPRCWIILIQAVHGASRSMF
jgi:hypothetical protein